MTRATDEMLMAFADDALPPADKARIAAELESDPEARAAVEEFRRASVFARAAVLEMMSDPMPENIIQTVLGPPGGERTIVDLAGRRRASRLRDMALPLAACLAIVASLGAVWFGLRSPTPSLAHAIDLGPVPAATPLADFLESRPSGMPTDFAGRGNRQPAQVMAVATFRDRNGRFCREIEVLGTGLQPVVAGVACRDPGRGGWTVEGAVRLATAAAPGTTFVPSGAAEKDALGGLLEILGAKNSLTPQEERSVIEKGWK